MILTKHITVCFHKRVVYIYFQDYGPKVNFKKKKLKCGVFSGLPAYSQWLVERVWKQPSLADFMPVELCNLEVNI